MDPASLALAAVVMAAVLSILIRLILWPYLMAKRIKNAVNPKADPKERENAREELGETGRRITSFLAVWFGIMVLVGIFFVIAPLLPEFLRWILLILAGGAGFILYSWAQNRI